MKPIPSTLALALLLPVSLCAFLVKHDNREIRLVCVVVVNQLRGDAPARLSDRFGDKGFNWIAKSGASYQNVHFENANTLTLVNEATLSTGAWPNSHGIVDNSWYDRETGREVNCIKDSSARLLTGRDSSLPGPSARRLLASTAGDELVLASAGKNRVYSVASKDKCAIFLSGGLGKAFWYQDRSGRMVTSTAFFKEMPAWAVKWNEADPARNYRGLPWTLARPHATYQFSGSRYQPLLNPGFGLDAYFPHLPDTTSDSAFYQGLTYTPFSDAVALKFACAVVDNEKLGQNGHTDLLWVSLSATDLIGHVFGPSSLEYEDNLIRLDKALGDFFEYIKKRVGAGKTLFCLTSDHGNSEVPALLKEKGLDAGRIAPREMTRQLNAELKSRFKTAADPVLPYRASGFVLNREALLQAKLDERVVEETLAVHAARYPGVARAFTRSALLSGRLPGDPVAQSAAKAFHPDRSGDVFIVQKYGWFLLAADNPNFSAMHGSPYSCDTHVPLYFSGPGVKPQTILRKISPADLAPTLCAILGIRNPNLCVGSPLPEVTGP